MVETLTDSGSLIQSQRSWPLCSTVTLSSLMCQGLRWDHVKIQSDLTGLRVCSNTRPGDAEAVGLLPTLRTTDLAGLILAAPWDHLGTFFLISATLAPPQKFWFKFGVQQLKHLEFKSSLDESSVWQGQKLLFQCLYVETSSVPGPIPLPKTLTHLLSYRTVQPPTSGKGVPDRTDLGSPPHSLSCPGLVAWVEVLWVLWQWGVGRC